MGEHLISWKPLRFVLWFPTLISCSPNLLRVYIRLCKHGNHFTFHHYKITMLCWTEWQVLGIVVVDWTWQLNNNFRVMHDKGFFFSSSLNNVLTLYTLTSEFIFYKLFSVYFQMYSQGEFVWISNYLYSGDCFLYSFDLNISFRGDIVIEIRC